MENSIKEKKINQDKKEVIPNKTGVNNKNAPDQKTEPSSDNVPKEYETNSSNKGQGPSGENL